MLVLTRRCGEEIDITVPAPDGAPVVIRVTVVAIDRTRIKLGFDAPRHVGILRGDVKQRDDRRADAPPRV